MPTNAQGTALLASRFGPQTGNKRALWRGTMRQQRAFALAAAPPASHKGDASAFAGYTLAEWRVRIAALGCAPWGGDVANRGRIGLGDATWCATKGGREFADANGQRAFAVFAHAPNEGERTRDRHGSDATAPNKRDGQHRVRYDGPMPAGTSRMAHTPKARAVAAIAAGMASLASEGVTSAADVLATPGIADVCDAVGVGVADVRRMLAGGDAPKAKARKRRNGPQGGATGRKRGKAGNTAKAQPKAAQGAYSAPSGIDAVQAAELAAYERDAQGGNASA